MGNGWLESGEGFVNSLINSLKTDTKTVAANIAGSRVKSINNLLEKNAGETGEKIAERLSRARVEKAGWEDIQTSVAKGAEKLTDAQVEFLKSTDSGGIWNVPRAAAAYMFEDGKKAARWGAYGTAMLGGRLISGGTPIHNNTGERDIAGIPFI